MRHWKSPGTPVPLDTGTLDENGRCKSFFYLDLGNSHPVSKSLDSGDQWRRHARNDDGCGNAELLGSSCPNSLIHEINARKKRLSGSK